MPRNRSHLTSGESGCLGKLETPKQQVPGKAVEIAPLASKVTLDGIISTVATLSGIPMEVILSRNRTRAVADARHLAMFLACEMFPDKTYAELAVSFHRDGTVVGHGQKQTRNHATVDKAFDMWVRLVRMKVRDAATGG